MLVYLNTHTSCAIIIPLPVTLPEQLFSSNTNLGADRSNHDNGSNIFVVKLNTLSAGEGPE